MKNNSDIKNLTAKINKWVRLRKWEKYQTPKDLAISITLEAAELLEHFQWKKDKEISKYVKKSKNDIGEEIADVAIYLFKLADKLGIDLKVAMQKKLKKAAKKYPAKIIAVEKDLEKYRFLKINNRAKRKKI